jgi:spore germination protein GerM
LNIRNGVAFMNFKKIVFEKLGNTTSSCGGGFYSSIEATLMQFPTVKKVVYAVEGNTNDYYEWVQVGECPHPKRLCSARNF